MFIEIHCRRYTGAAGAQGVMQLIQTIKSEEEAALQSTQESEDMAQKDYDDLKMDLDDDIARLNTDTNELKIQIGELTEALEVNNEALPTKEAVFASNQEQYDLTKKRCAADWAAIQAARDSEISGLQDALTILTEFSESV